MQQSTLHKKIVIRSVLPYTVIHSVGKQTLPVNLMQENFSNFMIFCDDALSMTTAREPGGSRRKTKEENYHYYLLENNHLKRKYVYTDIEEKEIPIYLPCS